MPREEAGEDVRTVLKSAGSAAHTAYRVKAATHFACCLQSVPEELSKLRVTAAAPGHSSDTSICLRCITAVVSVGSISQISSACSSWLSAICTQHHHTAAEDGQGRAVRCTELQGGEMGTTKDTAFAQPQGPQPGEQGYSWHCCWHITATPSSPESLIFQTHGVITQQQPALLLHWYTVLYGVLEKCCSYISLID